MQGNREASALSRIFVRLHGRSRRQEASRKAGEEMTQQKEPDKFVLRSSYRPTGDQPEAIDRLVQGLQSGMREQTLLGVTGSGKTFTTVSYTPLDVYKRQLQNSARNAVGTNHQHTPLRLGRFLRNPHTASLER